MGLLGAIFMELKEKNVLPSTLTEKIVQRRNSVGK